jgi:hypothetical protein
MKIYGKLDLPEMAGGNATNLIIPSGTSFPTVATMGELFYLSADNGEFLKGLYVYDSTAWLAYSLTSSMVGYQPMHGHPDTSQTALSYNATTRTISIAPVSGSFDIWIKGIKHTYTQALSLQHAAETGEYYFYIDADGTPQLGTTFWNLYADIPCSWIYYNATTGKGFALNERHGAWRDPSQHIRNHVIDGTQIKPGGFSANSYVLNSSTNNAAINFGIASGGVMDEDLPTDISQLTAGGPYTILYREGSSGIWNWTTTATIPFLSGATYVQANTFVASAWQLTSLTSNDYVNYYVFASPMLSPMSGIFMVPGQAVFTSLSAAQAESVSSLSWGTVPFAEIAPIYKITLRVQSGWNGTTGRVRIIEFNRLSGSKSSLGIGAAATVHNALSGRSDVDSHPAAAITVTPSGNITSIEAQAALVELDTKKAATVHDHDTSISGSAAKLTTSRTIALTGDVTATGSFDGSANLSLAATGVAAAKLKTSRTVALTGGVTASGSFDGSANLSLATTVVSAPKLTTARTIAITGDVTASGSFDGSANLSLTAIGVAAAKLKTSRTISLTGDVTASGSFDGSSDLGLAATVVSAPKLTTARTIALTGDVTASGSFDGSANLSLASTVISAPKLTTARTIAITGDVTATGSFDGSANLSLTATGVSAAKLTTSRTIALTGDVTGSIGFDGSANVSIAATVADDSHDHATSISGSAAKLTTARTVSLTGDVTASGSFDGSANLSLASTVVSAPKLTTARNVSLTGGVTGTTTFDGSADLSLAATVVSAPKLTTSRTIALTGDATATGSFDGSANLSLAVTGVSAAKLTTPRAIALSGDVTGTANFDGSAGISISTTVADDSHNHSNYVLGTSGTATDLILAKSKVRQATDQSAGSGTVTFDYNNGDYLKVTATGNISIALSNFPTGYVTAITIQCVNFGAYTITWPL